MKIKMAEELNERKIRKELIEIYTKFVQGDREEAISEAIEYDIKFWGLTSEYYNKYLSFETIKDLGGLSEIYQYGMRPNDRGYSNEALVSLAKKILKEIKS